MARVTRILQLIKEQAFLSAMLTQEARVALGYRLVQLLRIFRALQTSRVHP